MESEIKGSIYGFLAGNALASQCSNSSLSYSDISQQIARRYSDPGAMTLCTMDSILESNRVDVEDIAFKFNEWYIGSYLASGERTQSRIGVSQSLRMYSNGMPPDRCGTVENIVDNSALIRMLPLALFHLKNPIDQTIKDCHLLTKFTNQETTAQVCSALYVLVIQSILLNNQNKPSKILMDYYKINNLEEHNKELSCIIQSKTNNSDDVIGTFWKSMRIFAKFKDSPEDLFIHSILNQNDPESISSITGSLLGSYSGIKNIPNKWLKNLLIPIEAKAVINEFVKICV